MAIVERQKNSDQVKSRAVSDELVKLRRGEITLDEYLEARVEEAVTHLKSLLSAEDFTVVQEIVRTELRTDPVLVEMVRRATGREPRRS